MADFATATIIAFPARRAEETAEQRLARALARLQGALAEQRTTIAEWRHSLETLRDSVGGLGSSMAAFDRGLTTLRTEIGCLNGHASRLAEWAGEQATV